MICRMERIISHNLKNKENIANAIVLIFDIKNNFPEYLQLMLLERLLWATTEHDDEGKYKKYIGQPYWSIGALRQVQQNLASQRNFAHNLRHEHAVPKKEIRKRIIALAAKNHENVMTILDDLGHAVVVSKDEDDLLNKAGLRSKMPLDLVEKPLIGDVFSRYKEAGIKVCCISDRDIKRLALDEIDEIEKQCI